ncbi:MAG: nickel pincer cofactor biosynthesis protein LarC [Blastocatellia bacterium]|nr:nickel pincer cofactor biosynthesis protein LarC [Blastocatellia bacterium]
MRTLYFDCFAGASGDMILGALIDLGLDQDDFLRQLRSLNVPDDCISFDRVDRSGISAAKVNVIVPEETKHRHLHHIEEIINSSDLSGTVKSRAIKIFTNLAAAEAKVHGIEVKNVHFHEVGALDAITDIVGACVGFEMLGIEQFACSKIHVGSGFVEMEHGRFPVPPPAVAELLRNVPIYTTDIEGELITPTGAAIIATLCSSYGGIPEMKVEQMGYGAGTRQYDRFPNVIRLMVGQSEEVRKSGGSTEELILLETNIDDQSPQVTGFAMEQAFELGALDCWLTPIHMKKSRPGVVFSVLCTPSVKERLMEMLYTETTTLGIRRTLIKRHSLERRSEGVQTDYGTICVKFAMMHDKIVNVMPEFEEVRKAALEHGVSFETVNAAARSAFGKAA